jgi:hypothetical protein
MTSEIKGANDAKLSANENKNKTETKSGYKQMESIRKRMSSNIRLKSNEMRERTSIFSNRED